MSINIEQVAATVSACATVLAVGGAGFAWLSRHLARSVALAAKEAAQSDLRSVRDVITKRIDDSDEKTAAQVADLTKRSEEDRLEMAKQFGGNSGGMRQSINEGNGLVASVAQDLAKLTGRFDQYVEEHRR